jgi:site-specific DNA-cytosine methylase/very-short-patch-repair endonuclease
VEEKLTAVGTVSGIGSMLCAARQAGFEVLGNVEHRKYYHAKDKYGRNTFTENFPGAIFKHSLDDLSLEEIERLMNPTLALGHADCFPGDSKVYTSKGWKPIKNIDVGDLVLTHAGRFKPVLRLISKKYQGDILCLRTKAGPGENGTLFLTLNHPVRVGESWVKAEDVRPGDSVKVLSMPCSGCSKPIPIFAKQSTPTKRGTFCSIPCAVNHQWASASAEEKSALVRRAHEETRRKCAEKDHPFYDRSLRLSAADKLKSEKAMDEELRRAGLVLERQWPVDVGPYRYFIDFAIPGLKIGIEVDGWHHGLRRERDDARELRLISAGWVIVHVDVSTQKQFDFRAVADEVKRLSMNHGGEYEFIDVPIREIEKKPRKNETTVYNLSVLDDNSYVVKGFAVKNCGNFSTLSGSLKDRHLRAQDPGDIPDTVAIVKKFQPRFFALDNLPGSLKAYSIQKYAEELPDYDLFPEWVSNWGYGNVQKYRNRFFLLGARKEEKWAFVPGEFEHNFTVADVIRDLPEPRAGSNFPNHDPHSMTRDSPRALNCGGYRRKLTWAEVAEYFRDKPTGFTLQYERSDGSLVNRIGFVKGHWDGPAHVLTGGNASLHALRCDPLTIRERARIQGFPDDFVFYGVTLDPDGTWDHDVNRSVAIRQTGKAMPIQFCRYVSWQVADHVQGRQADPSYSRRVLRPNEHVDQAKLQYCETRGYADQEKACAACWLYDRCTVRSRKYGIGAADVAQGILIDPVVEPKARPAAQEARQRPITPGPEVSARQPRAAVHRVLARPSPTMKLLDF